MFISYSWSTYTLKIYSNCNLAYTVIILSQSWPRVFCGGKAFCQRNESDHVLLCLFFEILFQEYVSKGISDPLFYGDLVYKLRRAKDTPNFISSGSKIVKRLRRRQYDQLIIEMTIDLVLGPSTALHRPLLKRYSLTYKAVWTIWRAFSKTQRRQGPDLRSFSLIVIRDSFSHQTWARFQTGGAQPVLFGCH